MQPRPPQYTVQNKLKGTFCNKFECNLQETALIYAWLNSDPHTPHHGFSTRFAVMFQNKLKWFCCSFYRLITLDFRQICLYFSQGEEVVRRKNLTDMYRKIKYWSFLPSPTHTKKNDSSADEVVKFCQKNSLSWSCGLSL